MLKEVATFINQRIVGINTYWVLDMTMFTGHIPLRDKAGKNLLQIPRMCAILEGTAADVIGDLPDRADKPIQILNRNDNYFEARKDAMEFFTDLHGLVGCDLPVITSGSEYVAMIIDAMATPQPVENPDEKDRFWFSTNYLFRIRAK